MILINSAGFELKDGFKNETKPEVIENIKRKFNKNEISVLIVATDSFIFIEKGKRNKDILINSLYDYGILTGGFENSFIEKLIALNDNEVINLIQMIFECNKKKMLIGKRIGEVISEVWTIKRAKKTIILLNNKFIKNSKKRTWIYVENNVLYKFKMCGHLSDCYLKKLFENLRALKVYFV